MIPQNRLENNPNFEYDGSHEAPAISRIIPKQFGQAAELSIETSAPSDEVKSTLAELAISEAVNAEPEKPETETIPKTEVESTPETIPKTEVESTPETKPKDPLETLSPEKLALLTDVFGEPGDFDYAAFVKLHGMHRLLSDARYVKRCKERFKSDNTEEDYIRERSSKLFEQILMTGINTHYLLGNFPDEEGKQPFEVSAFSTTEYDDIYNCIDCGISIKLPPESIKSTTLPEKLCFGIDFTTSRSYHTLEDKLTKSTNDPIAASLLPVGYSQLKYFDDGEEKIDRDLPRLVIALDKFEDPEAVANLSPTSMESLTIRFKMLDQLSRQAKLRADKADLHLESLESLPQNSPDELDFAQQELDIYTELGDRFRSALERTALLLTTTVREDGQYPGQYIHIPRPSLLGFKTASITRDESAGRLTPEEASEKRIFIIRRTLSDRKREGYDVTYRNFNDLLLREERDQANIRALRESASQTESAV